MNNPTKTGQNIRRLRGKDTQTQLSFDINVAPSTVSAFETGYRKIPPDVASAAMEKFDDPRLAMEAANEYTAGAWTSWLDGPAVDLHRSSVKTKAEEELEEALEAIRKAKLNIHPDYLGNFDRDDIETSLGEAADAVTALNTYIAIICKEYRISWLKVWLKHKKKLISRGFINFVKGEKK